MSATPDAVAALKSRFPQVADRASLDHPALDVPASDLPAILTVLRDELGYDMLVDATAIDWAEGANPRFTVVYHVYSTTTHAYVRLAAACPDNAHPEVPTVTGVWAAANWHEREIFDMFGIRFTGHPDLRRILMWDGYPHFPLRKEFPLAGLDTPLPDEAVAAETGVGLIPAPMAGGPFVAASGGMNLSDAEPEGKDQSWNERREKPQV